MNAVQLFAAGDVEHSPVYMCRACGRLYTRQYMAIGDKERRYSDAERDALAHGTAERCCNHRCEICGEPAWGDWQGESKRHQRERCSRVSAEKEAARFAKATKIPQAEWDDSAMLYSEQSDLWFRDLDEALDWYSGEDRETPEYLWVGTRVRKVPDVIGWVMDHLSDDYDEDASERVSDEALARLTAFFAGWWQENEPESYDVDYRRCVVLDRKDYRDSRGESMPLAQ